MAESKVIGDFTYGNPRVLDWGDGTRLIVGKFCSIADDVTVFLGGEHRGDWVTTYPFPAFKSKWPTAKNVDGHPKTKGDVIVGNDVWIGYGALILSGVKIGDGAVIGAKAVITSDVRPYAVVVGNPGREIKRRFSDEIVEELLRIKWWDWPHEKISENMKLLCSGDIMQFIEVHRVKGSP